MSENKQHRTIEQIENESKALFAGGTFRWNKSEAEIWNNLEKAMDVESDKKIRNVNFMVVRYAVAAVFVALVSVGAFVRYYTQKVEALPGEHLAHVLPDGSKVELNAQSRLSYQPYWWRFSRKLKFEGEGFFEVEKGKKFQVQSQNGITEVLGTSFNIYARQNQYRVTCYTGKVKVTSIKQKEVILKPDNQIIFDRSGAMLFEENVNANNEISWMDDLFIFTATPLSLVIDEIERQYAVKIKNNASEKLYFTGNFNRTKDVDDVLNLVCRPLGIRFKQTTNNTYIITQNDN